MALEKLLNPYPMKTICLQGLRDLHMDPASIGSYSSVFIFRTLYPLVTPC